MWNHVTQSYVTQDKYVGRDIRTDDFPSHLAKFFFDGDHLLVYHIPVLLHKLYGLAKIINRLKGYRFYGCSLLFIYDGDHETQETYRKALFESPGSSHGTKPKRSDSVGRRLPRESNHDEDQHRNRSSLRRTLSEEILGGPAARHSRHSRVKKRGEINIRIVDFAHTTTGRDFVALSNSNGGHGTAPAPAANGLPHQPSGSVERSESVKPNGKDKVNGYYADVDPETGLIRARFPPHRPERPDLGFIFGLKNLSVSLERIWDEERSRRARQIREGAGDVEPLERLNTEYEKAVFDNIFQGEDEDPGNFSS